MGQRKEALGVTTHIPRIDGARALLNLEAHDFGPIDNMNDYRSGRPAPNEPNRGVLLRERNQMNTLTCPTPADKI